MNGERADVVAGPMGYFMRMEKAAKTKDELAELIITELRSFECKNIFAVAIVPVVDRSDDITWTVSCFKVGKAGREACDQALQQIVPRFQRIYDLVQKH